MRRSQQGLSLTGFLIFLMFFGFVAWMVMKLLPAYLEYGKIKQSMKSVAQDSSVGTDAPSIREALQKRLDVNDIDQVKAKDITLRPESGERAMEYSYERRIPLVANIDLVTSFEIKEPAR
ncbi:DUF4845 domain-containing protein [Lysobacter soyae]|jgi:hypothetical protein|uniref:DUF4845 domain-containing protein n=1 Tax=Lysobacter soyae TaxID=2764185 RepID=A0ABX8WNI9_9GAMM|nr:DUF4845 domain-containing protein [Lysobacter sp. CJ11]QYR52211.1 DUF4845 domain-containing protein [Lysobacter sp. CJ11]